MGTIKADTVTGLADPNKATIPNTITMGSTTATLNFGNTTIANASAGSTTITGEGGTTTTSVQQGLVKAWCKFQGDAGSISNDDSFNVSGLTDNGTGDYTIAIDNDMANDDYATTCCSAQQVHAIYNASNTLVGSIRIYILGTSESNADGQEVSVQITGDLA